MGNLQTYTKATVYFNGGKLSEEASVTIKRMTNSQEVDTVDKGYSGESPGSAKIEISVSNAVPSVDFEMNPGDFMLGVAPGAGSVEISIFAANRTLTTKGFVISDNFSHAVNSASKLDFEMRCSPANWE